MQKSILIIGGGVAGLASAVELAREGCAVTLLEARERLGGRIFTVQTNVAPVELGAEFIHGCDKELSNRIRAGKLKTTEVPDRNQLFLDGSLQDVDLWKEIGRVMKRIDKNGADRSFQEFIAIQKLPALTKELAASFVEGFNAANVAKIGVHGLAETGGQSGDEGEVQQSRLTNGYAALVESFAHELESLGVTVKTNSVVKSIAWKGAQSRRSSVVEAIVEHAGKELHFAAEVAIITVPLGVLKAGSVVFDPPLTSKQKAIDALEFGNVRKVVLAFRRRFWPEPNFGFIHALEERIPTWWSDDRGNLLTGWAGGPTADAFNGWTEEELISEATTILGRMWKLKPTAIRHELIAFHTHDWREDPFSRGAYSYIPVRGLKLVEELAQPIEDTLFFAGEAAASGSEPGTVHGALASGLRVAREVQAP